MRWEILRFWEQAQEDLETARYNSAGGKFYAAAFFCQQAVEKALKALYMHQTREPPPSTHSLVVLGRLVDAPKSFHRFLKELTAEYVVSRYPNATDEIPARLYDAELVAEYVSKAQEVLAWVQKTLGL
jgi:HEPN domain-containing protein